MKAIISNRVFAEIKNYLFRHRCNEAGGLLLGAKFEEYFVLIDWIMDGPLAQRNAVSLKYDTDYMEEIYQKKLQDMPLVECKGFFHSHIWSPSRPSPQDKINVFELMNDKDWNFQEALFPIAILYPKYRFIPFLLTKDLRDFQKIPLEIARDEDPIISAFLNKIKISIDIHLKIEVSYETKKERDFFKECRYVKF